MPVSREDHIDRVFHALEMLECDQAATSLFVYVDGDAALFVKTRNLVEQSKFDQRLCVQRPQTTKPKLYNIMSRRARIAAVHTEAKQYITGCEYVLLTEDDTVIPSHGLKQLLADYAAVPYAGFISGVELGRWGIPHVGAWAVDDPYEPSRIESPLPRVGLETVDAAGLYCCLTKADRYLKHEFKPFGETLGPDFNYGISLRQEGFKNYVDWSVKCEHRTQDKSLTFSNTQPVRFTMTKERNRWRQQVTSE